MSKPKAKESAAPAVAAPASPGFFDETGAAFASILGFNPGGADGVEGESGSVDSSEGSGGGEGGGKSPAPTVVEIKHLFEPLSRSAVPTTAPGSEGESNEGDGAAE